MHRSPQKSATKIQTTQTNRPVEMYVNFLDESVLNVDQINLFLHHAVYFDNIPICGKGVKENLTKHLDYWKCASEFVIDIIKHGYVVPFQNAPPPMKFKNNKSALEDVEFVDD